MVKIDQADLDKVISDIKDFNFVLSNVLPQILPETEKVLQNIAPISELLFKYFFSGKTYNSLLLMGNSTYLARALLQSGMDPVKAATKAVACAQKIVELTHK